MGNESHTMGDEIGYLKSLAKAAAESFSQDYDQEPQPESSRDRGGSRPRRDDAIWMDNVPFERDTKRRIMARRQNIYLALKHDPALDGLLAFDVFSQKVVIQSPVPVDEESTSETGFPRQFGAIDLSRLVRYFEKNSSFPRFGEKEVDAAVKDFADRVKVNSLSDSVKSLRHDGVMRMHRLFEHYFSASHDGPKTATGDSYYLARLSTWFMTGLVRRAITPGCKFDYVIVLNGAQGLSKSLGLSTLGGGEPLFTDGMPTLKQKDSDPKRFYDHLRGRWLVEIAEAKAVKGVDSLAVKEFLTQAIDRYIPAYGSEAIVMPRGFVFVMTRNPEEGNGFSQDSTGNRRFWPIECGKVRVDEIGRDRDQLIAEAVEYIRFADGYDSTDLNFYPEEEFEVEFLKPLQAELVEKTEYDDIVESFLANYGPDRVRPIEIIRQELGKTAAMPSELKEVGKALARTRKWRRAASANGGYVRVEPSAEPDDSDLPF
jgi:putative DNA primase/helicase